MIPLLKRITKSINAVFIKIVLFITYFFVIGSAWLFVILPQFIFVKKRSKESYWVPTSDVLKDAVSPY